ATGIGPAPQIALEALPTSAGLASFWTTDRRAEPAVGSDAVFGFALTKLEMRVGDLTLGPRVATCLSTTRPALGHAIRGEEDGTKKYPAADRRSSRKEGGKPGVDPLCPWGRPWRVVLARPLYELVRRARLQRQRSRSSLTWRIRPQEREEDPAGDIR